MCDLFLTLAQGPAGLTCFLLPRVLPDGARNGMRLQRLKDKLGNRSNASAEIEFDGALAWQVGEPGRGVATIIAMVSATRLDCVLGSAAGIRAATVAAVHHTSHRLAFGKELAAQPLMANVLADLSLESEAATVLAFRLAGAADRAARGDAGEAALLPPSRHSWPGWRLRTSWRHSTRPGGWPGRSRSPWRRRCLCGTRPRRCPAGSACPGSAHSHSAALEHRSARCPPGWTWQPSPTAPAPRRRAGPGDAALAGNPLPAGRHLGRRRHQLRGVLRGRRGSGTLPVRRP